MFPQSWKPCPSEVEGQTQYVLTLVCIRLSENHRAHPAAQWRVQQLRCNPPHQPAAHVMMNTEAGRSAEETELHGGDAATCFACAELQLLHSSSMPNAGLLPGLGSWQNLCCEKQAHCICSVLRTGIPPSLGGRGQSEQA